MLKQQVARRLSLMLGGGLLVGAAIVASPAAHAHGSVQWSIGINLPPVGAVVSSRPVYGPPPAVIYAPPPAVVYAPVYSAYPAYPVYAPPPRVVFAPVHGWAPPPGRHWRDRDRDGIPDRWERRPGWGYGHSHGPPPGHRRGW